MRVRRSPTPARVSVGAAPFEPDGEATDEDLIVAADMALHEAKERGGDRFLVSAGRARDRLAWVGNVRAAIDDDLTTAWQTPFDDVRGQYVEYAATEPVTFDHLDLAVVADGRHSVPTRLRLEVDGDTREIALPEVVDQVGENSTSAVSVSFPAITGRRVRVTVLEEEMVVRPVTRRRKQRIRKAPPKASTPAAPTAATVTSSDLVVRPTGGQTPSVR